MNEILHTFLKVCLELSNKFGSGNPEIDTAFAVSLIMLPVFYLLDKVSPSREKEKILQESNTQTVQEEQSIEKDTKQEVKVPARINESSYSLLGDKLVSSRRGILAKIKAVFADKPLIDDSSLLELESLLISSDLGVTATKKVLTELRTSVADGQQLNKTETLEKIKENLKEILTQDVKVSAALLNPKRDQEEGPKVIVIVGVNGVGKTTTVAKLAQKYSAKGSKVLLVAGDTFRAAATEQLKTWADRIGVEVVIGAENAKPASVVFDAVLKAKESDYDLVIIDTAGRLHNKSNLMQELSGIKNSVTRHLPNAPHEVLLVVDGATGQNALSQAKEFNEATNLTGVIVTKLDGTPKGGIVVAIKDQFNLPVRFIGVGESAEDLREFNEREFVEALLDQSDAHDFNNDLDSSNVYASPVSAHAGTRRRRREG